MKVVLKTHPCYFILSMIELRFPPSLMVSHISNILTQKLWYQAMMKKKRAYSYTIGHCVELQQSEAQNPYCESMKILFWGKRQITWSQDVATQVHVAELNDEQCSPVNQRYLQPLGKKKSGDIAPLLILCDLSQKDHHLRSAQFLLPSPITQKLQNSEWMTVWKILL